MNPGSRLFRIFLFGVLIFSSNPVLGHEPLYGFGPHVLFKGGFAPHFTYHHSYGHLETEYALGYGLTRDWTVKGEVPFHIENGHYHWSGFKFKQKYRLFSKFDQGRSRQISAISTLSLPVVDHRPTVFNIGATGGQEALHWYWFYGASYGMKFTDRERKPGDHLLYNATIGYRPMKVAYDKADIVFFLEGRGKFQQKAVRKGETLSRTGGHAWSVAPTFMLTYRNVALRGGVEFGLGEAQYLNRPETNYKLILEWHL